MDPRIMKAMANRQRFRTMSGLVPAGMATPEALAMKQWFEVYFATYPEHENVDIEQLKWLIQQRSQGQPPEAVHVTLAYADLLASPIDEASIRGAVGTLYDLDFQGRVGAVLAAYSRGEEIDPVHEIEVLARATKRAKSNGKADDFERTSIAQILADIGNDRGIKFTNLQCLHDSVAAMQGGASVAVGARPDQGKTSFIADCVRCFAPQCVNFFGSHRPILWLNNEGTALRIIPRLYQAALGINIDQMTAKSNAGTLEQEYMAALGIPNLEYIRVKNVHGASLAQIEQIIEDMNPCIVIYDMLANVRMSTMQGGNKADAVEQAWQQVREMAVNYDHIAISTVQISAEGNNQLFPSYSALKDSKTGVQGATDLIIMLGSLVGAEFQSLRGVSTPKNKFSVPGKPSIVEERVYFNKDTARWDDGSGAAVQTAPPSLPNQMGGVPL